MTKIKRYAVPACVAINALGAAMIDSILTVGLGFLAYDRMSVENGK